MALQSKINQKVVGEDNFLAFSSVKVPRLTSSLLARFEEHTASVIACHPEQRRSLHPDATTNESRLVLFEGELAPYLVPTWSLPGPESASLGVLHWRGRDFPGLGWCRTLSVQDFAESDVGNAPQAPWRRYLPGCCPLRTLHRRTPARSVEKNAAVLHEA